MKYDLFGSVESRANMFQERLLLTQQRLLRSGQFTLKGLNRKSNAVASNKDGIHEVRFFIVIILQITNFNH